MIYIELPEDLWEYLCEKAIAKGLKLYQSEMPKQEREFLGFDLIRGKKRVIAAGCSEFPYKD